MDLSSNQNSCSFTVTVNDTEKPVILCLGDIQKPTDLDACTAVVTWMAPTFTITAAS